MINFSLTGKVALVTGAAYGIGFAIARALAEAGAKIAFNCRSEAHMEQALADYKALGIDARGYICDVTKEQDVASDAIAVGIEAGYDLFSQIAKLREKEQKLYVFARYDYYDSMYKVETGVYQYDWCGRTRLAAGVNYYPIKDIVIKGEYSIGLLKSKYNNEPSISLGVAYAGLFGR